jgi:ubiquinone biosynthesis protein
MIRALRHLGRAAGIVGALARADALFALEHHPQGRALARALKPLIPPRRDLARLRPGQRLATALTGLGPTFIKFGQALSTRADLLGDQIAADLAELQDRLPPFPFADAKRLIEADLGRPLNSAFASFETVPVAAASIAQVHFATDSDGRAVAVKVLRPRIREAFADDLDFLDWLAGLVERFAPRLARLKTREVVATFAETVRIEMDLRFEAAAAQELAENFAGAKNFKVPAVDWQRTGPNILTLERVAGLKVDDRAAVIAAGLDPVAVVRTAAEVFFGMVFRHGFFHADMHPGNLFVAPAEDQPGGLLIAMDFGIMGRIDAETRKTLGEMLLGFLTRDYRKVAEVHIAAGYVPGHKSTDAFAQACRSIAEPILGKPIAEISVARLLGQLFEITETFEMQVQPQLLLLQKSMLVAEGVGRGLAPEVNMWDLARPLVEGWMRERLGPEGRIGDAAATLAKIPDIVGRIDRATAGIERDGLKLHPSTAAALRGEGSARTWPAWLPWAAAAAILVVSLAA